MAISSDAQAIIDALKEQSNLLDTLNMSFNRRSSTTGGGAPAGGRDDLNFHHIRTSGADLAKSLTNYYLKTDQATKNFSTGMETFGKKLLDGTKGFNHTLKASGARFAEQLKNGEITAQDFAASIEQNKKALLDMKNAGVINRDQFIDLGRQLIRLRNETLTTAAAYERMEPVITAASKTWKLFDDTALRMVRSYQGSSDGFSTAANMARDGLSLMSTGAEKAGGYVAKFGGILSNSGNPMVAGLGVVASAAGVGLEAFGAISREVVEKAFPIFQTQITKMSASYNMAASTGALFGQGMTEMVNISSDAGLGIETFSKIIKENSEDLAKSGLGVAEGAKQVAGVGKIMRDSGTREELLKFGYSLEEQGGLIAQTIAKMRAGGGGAVDQQKVAEATAKYAKDLRTLADLTGEDVKTKQKQAQEAANNLAFQQELAQMAPEQREKIQRAMEAMAPIEQKAFMERMINHGNLMSEETAMAESQSAAFATKSRTNYELALAGQLDQGRQIQLNTEFAGAIQKDMLKAKDIAFAAFAGVETVGQLAKNYNDMLKQALQFTPEAIEANRKAQEELAKKAAAGGDPLTEKFAQITQKGEALRGVLDNLVTKGKGMDAYLTAVDTTTTKMLDYAAKFAGVETSEDRKAKAEQERKERENRAQIGGQLGTAARSGTQINNGNFFSRMIGIDDRSTMQSQLTRFSPEQIQKMAEDQGVTLQDLLKAAGLNSLEDLKRIKQKEEDAINANTGVFAEGGIGIGSRSGYPAVMHGVEAVLPLENPEAMAKIRNSLFGDGDNVMNKNSKDLATAMASMTETDRKSFEDKVTGIKSEQTAMMENIFKPNIQNQDRIADMLNNKFDEMISLLKDVSNHTELTSSRVA